MVSGCVQMSESKIDPAAGLNGGFEVTKNGLPVNWLMYTPNTVPNAQFEIVMDRETYKEGEQALKFVVDNCEWTGGWHSPGFTNEFFEVGRFWGEGEYILGFWLKNDGATFHVSAGGVSTKQGDMKTLIHSDQAVDDWNYHEFNISIKEGDWLRMELNILSPGTLWIDGVEIIRV